YSDFGIPSGVKRITTPRPVFCVGNQTALESVLQGKDAKTHHGKDRSKKTERDRAERQRQKPHPLLKAQRVRHPKIQNQKQNKTTATLMSRVVSSRSSRGQLCEVRIRKGGPPATT